MFDCFLCSPSLFNVILLTTGASKSLQALKLHSWQEATFTWKASEPLQEHIWDWVCRWSHTVCILDLERWQGPMAVQPYQSCPGWLLALRVENPTRAGLWLNLLSDTSLLCTENNHSIPHAISLILATCVENMCFWSRRDLIQERVTEYKTYCTIKIVGVRRLKAAP